jgi:hypothetical protein
LFCAERGIGQLPQPHHQGGETLLGGGGRRLWLDVLGLRIPGDHATIDAVGFLQLSHRLGETAHRAGTDDGNR